MQEFDVNFGSTGLDAWVSTTAPRYGLGLPMRWARPLEAPRARFLRIPVCLVLPRRVWYRSANARFLPLISVARRDRMIFLANDEL